MRTYSRGGVACAMGLRLLGAGTAVLAAAAVVVAGPARYDVTPGADVNLVRFESKAPLESFDGKTRHVSGHVTCDPLALGDSIDVEITVDLATLDTGIDLRNRHMRENHLETDRFPRAVFRGGRLHDAPAALAEGQTARFEISGQLELHGISRPLRVPVSVTVRGSSLHVITEFPVALADFAIRRPQFLMLKLSDTQRITAELRAAAGAEREQP